jgi:hypothetical protein
VAAIAWSEMSAIFYAQPDALEPSVGILWVVSDLPRSSPVLVTDRTTLAVAERYGEFLTHPAAHYHVWEAWRRLGPAGLEQRTLPTTIAWHEYEHFPRGRIVYRMPDRRFILYADRRLQKPATLDRIASAFALPAGSYEVASDPHYRTR